MLIKCSECKETKDYYKGFKIKPKPLCPKCVFLKKEVTCDNGFCRKTFLLKDGFRDECFECQNPLCKFCFSKEIILEGLEFYFCEEHSKPNMKELKEEAVYLSKI